MTALIGIGVRSGFKIVQYYFCNSLDRGDYTNEQIINVLENKLTAISKDLEDLKLQKLRSATFLVRSGVQVYDANDLQEAMRNFDKAEMDAIEGFSTAPSIEWKVLAIKLAICAHMWRKIVLAGDNAVNFESVIKQITMHIQRLLDEEGVRVNVKTHVTGSFRSRINKTKRIELINGVVEIDSVSRVVLFENFLEILPISYVDVGEGEKVSLASLSNYDKALVPFSPRQCSLLKPIPAIQSWRNMSCNIAAEMNKPNEMSSCGSNHQGTDVYMAQRNWIDLHLKVNRLTTSVQVFELSNPSASLTTPDDTNPANFEVVFVSIKAFVQSANKTAPRFTLSLRGYPVRIEHFSTKHADQGVNQEHTMLFYRGSSLVHYLNQEMGCFTVSVFAGECDISITTIEVVLHFKSKQWRYLPNVETGIVNMDLKM